jgi:hypothetical protein
LGALDLHQVPTRVRDASLVVGAALSMMISLGVDVPVEPVEPEPDDPVPEVVDGTEPHTSPE